MDNEQATFWLSQFIGKNLRIHASDGRVFGGQMKCTDKVRLQLALACTTTDDCRTATSFSHSPVSTVHRLLRLFAGRLKSPEIHLQA